MGDVWQAYKFIRKSAKAGDKLAIKALQSPAELAADEALNKRFLADRKGMKIGMDELIQNYEIKMKLVKRKKPLSKKALSAAKKISKKLKKSK